jgi:xanthine dehydrogenase accessory factor
MVKPTPDPGRSPGPATGAEGKSDGAPDIAPAAKPVRQTASLGVNTPDSGLSNRTDNSPDYTPGSASGDAPDNAPQAAVQNAAGTTPGIPTDDAPSRAPDRVRSKTPDSGAAFGSAGLADIASDRTTGNSPVTLSHGAAKDVPGLLSVSAPANPQGDAPGNAPAAKPARQTASPGANTQDASPDSGLDNGPNAPGHTAGNTPDISQGRASANARDDAAPHNASVALHASAADNNPHSSTCHAPVAAQTAPPRQLPGEATELAAFLAASPDVIRVRLSRVQGSSPRGEGTTMCVSATGICGTIGGGQLEYMAIDQARALLARGGDSAEMDVPLGPEIGQCCGGRVTVSLHRMEDADRAALLQGERAAREAAPHVYLYGAGHVGRALARAFASLPLRLLLVDSRKAELLLCSGDTSTCLTPLPEAVLRDAPPGAAHIIATHDHALDFLLTSEALARQDAAYVGLIGSQTKRTRFLRWHAEQMPGVPAKALICPIGGNTVPDKRPEVIAALVVAEVLQALAVWAKATAEV